MSSPRFYAVVNDLIGGWDVSEYDKPVSEHRLDEGEGTIAWGCTEEWAKRIASALNDQLTQKGN